MIQFLKTSWLADRSQLSYDAPSFSEADIDDAMAFSQDNDDPRDDDDMIVDEPREDEELEALFASYEQQQQAPRPPSPTMSDEEYDDIFAELLSQEQSQPRQQGFTDQMDSDETMDVSM